MSIMESRARKGKDVVGPSELSKKRVRPTGWVPRAPTIPRGQIHRYRTSWVGGAQKKWYTKHTECKYAPDEFIVWQSFPRKFSSIVWRLEEIHMNFIF